MVSTVQKTGGKLLLRLGCCSATSLSGFFIITLVIFVFIGIIATKEGGALENTTTTPPVSSIDGLLTPPNLGPPDANGYYDMPPSTEGLYTIYSKSCKRKGKLELIQMLYTGAKKIAEKYPNNKLAIGDLNAGAGHASHKNGIDVDIDIPGGMMVDGNYNRQLATDAAMFFFQTKLISMIFYNDDPLRATVNTYAKEQGLPGTMLEWPNHENHFHIRINVPKGPTSGPNC